MSKHDWLEYMIVASAAWVLLCCLCVLFLNRRHRNHYDNWK